MNCRADVFCFIDTQEAFTVCTLKCCAGRVLKGATSTYSHTEAVRMGQDQCRRVCMSRCVLCKVRSFCLLLPSSSGYFRAENLTLLFVLMKAAHYCAGYVTTVTHQPPPMLKETWHLEEPVTSVRKPTAHWNNVLSQRQRLCRGNGPPLRASGALEN